MAEDDEGGNVIAHDIDWPHLLHEGSLVIIAVSLLIVVVVVTYLLLRGKFQKVEAHVGSASLSLTSIDSKVDGLVTKIDSIDKAVNNVPKGQPPMIQRVVRLEEHIGRIDEQFVQLAKGHAGIANTQVKQVELLELIGRQLGVPVDLD